MRSTSILFTAVAATFVLGQAGFAQAPAPPIAQNAVNGASASTEAGFGIFQQKCLSCHGKAVVCAP